MLLSGKLAIRLAVCLLLLTASAFAVAPPAVYPPNGATNVPTNTTVVNWGSVAGAVSTAVYFGTQFPPPYIGTTTGNSYAIGYLNRNTQYFWQLRISLATDPFVIVSPVYYFTTEAAVRPTADYVSVSGTDSAPIFTAGYSSTNGYTDVIWAYLAAVPSLSTRAGCYVAYSQPGNSFYLMNDAADSWMGSLPANSPGTLQNSQCVVNGTGSHATGSGNTLTVTVSVTFKPAFSGPKGVYLFAQDASGLSTGWLSRGTWTVP